MATLLDLQDTLNSQGNILPGYEQLIDQNFNLIQNLINQHSINIENLQSESTNVAEQLNVFFEDRSEEIFEFNDIIEGSIVLSGYNITLPEGTYLKEEHIPLIEFDKILDTSDFVKMRSQERDFLLNLMSQTSEGDTLQIQINNNAFLNEKVQFVSGRTLSITQIAGETESDPIRIKFDSNIPLEYYRSSKSNILPWKPDPGNPYRYKVNDGPYEEGTLKVYINGHRIPSNLIEQSFAAIGEFRFISTLPLTELPNINSSDFLSADFDIPLIFGPDEGNEELGNWWGDIITQSDGSILDADAPLKPLRFYPISGNLGSSSVFQIRTTNPYGFTDTGIDTIYFILDISQIDHDLLKNYDTERHHLPGSDNQNLFNKFIDPNLKSITAFSPETTIQLTSEDDSIDINIAGNNIDFSIKTLNNVDIDSGTIDGTTIGGDDPAPGFFTQLTVIGPNTPVYIEKNDDSTNTGTIINASHPDFEDFIIEIHSRDKWVMRSSMSGRTDFRVNPGLSSILPTTVEETVATFSNDEGDAFISIINNGGVNSGVLFGDNTNETKIGIIADLGANELLSLYSDSDPGNYLRLNVNQERWIFGKDLQVLGNIIGLFDLTNLDTLTLDPGDRGYNTTIGSILRLINNIPLISLVADEDLPAGLFFGDETSPNLGSFYYSNSIRTFIMTSVSNISQPTNIMWLFGHQSFFGGNRFDIIENFAYNFTIPTGSIFNIQSDLAIMSLISIEDNGCGIYFGDETDTDSAGIFFDPIIDEISFLFGSSFPYQFTLTEFIIQNAQLLASEGTAGSPSISFDDANDSGFYTEGGISASVSGTRKARLTSTLLDIEVITKVDDGNTGYTPSIGYSFAVVGSLGTISCICTNGNTTGIHFGDNLDANQGGIFYDTFFNTLTLQSNGVNKIFVRNTYTEFIDEVQSDAFITPELLSNPTVTANTEAKIYMKGDKLVIIYDHVGTLKYRWLDLTSTDATWTYSVVAP